ncbi:Bug family tripartite tricarboxylate transporter substrate binding protein [Oryzicola mucosus]|uniref:Tripartite tricarboxylate transporter substrate binding protein n=1 Tax=Oryzicola mucosus TaxID=2767425 RepID=A0A8J6U0C0_9HYPH|nr:tripartite tricarboxylate transporter substrate-binding protein [Oryzicola mucosus]MBD0417369.1 hypothetical protein [Oryzicola mucosus]
MKLTRRQALAALSTTIAMTMTVPAVAADYPTKPVTVIVPFDPGGPVEIMGRIVLDKLSKKFGQQFVIETKPGASTAIGTEYVTRAKNDGYTILYTAVTALITLQLTKKDQLNFDISKDLVPVATTHTGAYILYVNPSLGFKTVKEFIDAAKAKPGEYSYSSTGVGAHTYFTSELFKNMTGTDILHVPYKGTGPATQAVVANEVSMIFGSPVLHQQYGKTGKLTALGVSSPKSISQFPEIPPLSNTVPGFQTTYAFTFFAPKDTPKEIVDALNGAVNEALAMPDVREKILAVGEPGGTSPEQTKLDMQKEQEKLQTLVEKTGMKLE